jgi:peptidoglycan/xylan/chitin deacetylase (PgdA/CDA1 family)
MQRERFILLTFDVEEFDTPLQYHHPIGPGEQLHVGYQGLFRIKELLHCHNVPVTFFTTAHFANNYSNLIRELSLQNEIASHTYYHNSFQISDLNSSRITLEKIINAPVSGIRMPRMNYLRAREIIAAGYKYDSSLNPTWLPLHYNHLDKPATAFWENDLLRIPASASPLLRIPLFWLSFKNFPYSFYVRIAKETLKKFGYLSLYFHPWEFTDLSQYNIPRYIKNPNGDVLLNRLSRLITDLEKSAHFITMSSFHAMKHKEKAGHFNDSSDVRRDSTLHFHAQNLHQ